MADEPREAAPTRAYVPELIPLDQGWSTQWLVSFEAGAKANPDDPHAGWITVDADARRRLVEMYGDEMSPVEARLLAAALVEAARHAESYGNALLGMLSHQEPYVGIDLPNASTTEKRAVHEWFRATWSRVLRWRDVGHPPIGSGTADTGAPATAGPTPPRPPWAQLVVDGHKTVVNHSVCAGCGSSRIVQRHRRWYCTEPRCDRRLPGPLCETCRRPRSLHVCLTCTPDGVTPGEGCHNCRRTGWDQTPCLPPVQDGQGDG